MGAWYITTTAICFRGWSGCVKAGIEAKRKATDVGVLRAKPRAF